MRDFIKSEIEKDSCHFQSIGDIFSFSIFFLAVATESSPYIIEDISVQILSSLQEDQFILLNRDALYVVKNHPALVPGYFIATYWVAYAPGVYTVELLIASLNCL